MYKTERDGGSLSMQPHRRQPMDEDGCGWVKEEEKEQLTGSVIIKDRPMTQTDIQSLTLSAV